MIGVPFPTKQMIETNLESPTKNVTKHQPSELICVHLDVYEKLVDNVSLDHKEMPMDFHIISMTRSHKRMLI